MKVLRFLGRVLLASYFIGHGVRALRASQTAVQDAEPVVDQVHGLAERFLPESVRRWLPTKTTAFVRCHGLTEIFGGLMMASGLGRRPGAALLVAGQVFRVAAGNPSSTASRAPISPELGRDLALLGAVLIEALDTQGQPSLAWRIGQKRQAMTSEIQTKSPSKAARKAKRKLKSAL